MISNNFYTTNPKIRKGINKEYFIKLKFLQAAVAGLILSVCNIANAELIDMRDYIYGDSNNVDWLKLDSTLGLSYNEIVTLINSGSLNGWNYANNTQFSNLINGIGGVPLPFITPSNINWDFNNNPLFNATVQMFQSTIATPLIDTYINGYLLNTGIGEVASFNNFDFDDWIETNHWQGAPDLNFKDSNTGAWLIRDHVSSVPEPSTLTIFTLGIMGLASRRFKKK